MVPKYYQGVFSPILLVLTYRWARDIRAAGNLYNPKRDLKKLNFLFRNMAEAWTGSLSVHTKSFALINRERDKSREIDTEINRKKKQWDRDRVWQRDRDIKREKERKKEENLYY